MKAPPRFIPRDRVPITPSRRLLIRRIGMAWCLPVLFLLVATATVRAHDFICSTNGGQIAIVGYTGTASAVSIPDTIDFLPVTSIAYPAFYGSTNLTSVTIPASVASIGNGVFDGCTNLATITVDALNSTYSSHDGILFNEDQTTLIQCPAGRTGSYTIPESVTSVDFAAFCSCSRLTDVTIPDSVTSIGQASFAYCASLTSITIPESVTSIGDWAFRSCTRLTTITVDALNSAYSSVDGVLFNKDQTTLIQCPGGQTGSYTVPNRVADIGNEAFLYCTSLTDITIPDSVTSIGTWAFFRCSSLTNVMIGNRLTNIGDYAFAECTSLIGAYFQGNAPSVGSDVFYHASNVTVYYLPGTTGWGSTFSARPTAQWNLHTSAVTVTPTSRDFGPVQVGSTSNLTFTVQNTGVGTLSGTSSVPAPYSIFSGGTYTLEAGASQTIIVRYSPTAAGTNNQTVTFTGGAAALLTGTAYPAPLTNRPTLNWPQVRGAISYRIYIWNHENGTVYLDQWLGRDAHWIPSSDMPAGTYEYWIQPRIKTRRGGMTGAWWPSADYGVPFAVPHNLAHPILVWPETHNATEYRLYITKGGTLYSDQWLEQTDPYWTTESDLPAGQYEYWILPWIETWRDRYYGPWWPSDTDGMQFTITYDVRITPSEVTLSNDFDTVCLTATGGDGSYRWMVRDVVLGACIPNASPESVLYLRNDNGDNMVTVESAGQQATAIIHQP